MCETKWGGGTKTNKPKGMLMEFIIIYYHNLKRITNHFIEKLPTQNILLDKLKF